MAVAAELDEAVLIGAEDGHPAVGKGLESCGVGVPVTIFKAGGDEADVGGEGVQQIGSGGGAAAVVTDLQDVRMLQDAVGNELAFNVFFHVACEQKRSRAVLQAQNEGVVVVGGVAGRVIGCGGKNLNACAAVIEGLAAMHFTDGDAELACSEAEFVPRGVEADGAGPEFTRAKIF